MDRSHLFFFFSGLALSWSCLVASGADFHRDGSHPSSEISHRNTDSLLEREDGLEPSNIECTIHSVDVEFDNDRDIIANFASADRSGTNDSEDEYSFLHEKTHDDHEEDFVCLTKNDKAYHTNLPTAVLKKLEKRRDPVVISSAVIDEQSGRLSVTSPDFTITPMNHHIGDTYNRNMAQTQGTSTALVLRVSYQGTGPTLSRNVLAGRIFGLGSRPVDVNLASQLFDCSFGKLQVIPAVGDNIIDGILEVAVNEAISGDNTVRLLENLAVEKAAKILGVTLSHAYDHVLVVLPDVGLKYGGRGFLAYAYLNGSRSVFHDVWAGSVSALVHEIGHNLNLRHAGSGDKVYGDVTGYMGYGTSEVGGPASCFNAQKHWSLGWFNDRSLSLTPDDLPWGGYLAAFVDYSHAPPDECILINIGQSNPRLFLQYNRAKGVNDGTRDLEDLVVIVRDEGEPDDFYGLQSWLEGGIMVNHDKAREKYRYSNFHGGSDLVVKVCSKFADQTDRVRLSVHLDDGIQEETCHDVLPSDKCEDSTDLFYVEQRDLFRDCAWLSRNIDRWETRLCVHDHDAFHMCPVACGRCPDVCKDSESETFYVNSRLGYKGCRWLSRRPRWQARLCVDGHDAKEICCEMCSSYV